MIKSIEGNPCLDSVAHLSQQYKDAALNAGHGIHFLSDEAKYAQTLAAQKAATEPVGQKLDI